MSDMKNKVTIKTLAEDLNVSFSTVAKALNYDPKVKAETIELVNRRAKELGYRPNFMAKGLKNCSSKCIGFILNDVENPALAYIFKRVSVHMEKFDYSTLICDSQYDATVEHRNILSVLSKSLDALIVFLVSSDSSNIALLNEFADKVILLGDCGDYPQFSCVAINYELGGYLSAKEMLQNGHHDCVVFSEPSTFPASQQYLIGIRRAYDEFNLTLDDNRIFYSSPSIDNGCNSFMNLWDPNQKCTRIPFTGVLTFCDSLAHGVYKACKMLGLSVPDDISVIGFDDNPLSVYSDPPLTTIYLPKERMLECCINILEAKLLKENRAPIKYYIDPHLVIRESVKNLKGSS